MALGLICAKLAPDLRNQKLSRKHIRSVSRPVMIQTAMAPVDHYLSLERMPCAVNPVSSDRVWDLGS
jgi:hypothetical protein